jgi:hypothetical protein
VYGDEEVYYQQDRAPACSHCSEGPTLIIMYLQKGNMGYSSHPLDLTLHDFYLWGNLKDSIWEESSNSPRTKA